MAGHPKIILGIVSVKPVGRRAQLLLGIIPRPESRSLMEERGGGFSAPQVYTILLRCRIMAMAAAANAEVARIVRIISGV
jgi:hypothetical protein